ncbi:MAG: restriction endonuclease [Aureispira sp.]
MRFSLDEIKDWKDFEKLIEDYFRIIVNAQENNLTEVKVEPSGEGSDGGRDIFLTFRVNDSVVTYERKWVVQCKFYSKNLSLKNLATVNIPSLIHMYNADGYLLVCKPGVTAKVTEMFEQLRRKCSFKYDYEIWDENTLISKLMVQPDLIRKFFPDYQDYLRKKNVDIDI